jgi:hypothetical protein
VGDVEMMKSKLDESDFADNVPKEDRERILAFFAQGNYIYKSAEHPSSTEAYTVMCKTCTNNPKLRGRPYSGLLLGDLMTKLPRRIVPVKEVAEHPAYSHLTIRTIKKKLKYLCDTGHIRFISKDAIEMVNVCDQSMKRLCKIVKEVQK